MRGWGDEVRLRILILQKPGERAKDGEFVTKAESYITKVEQWLEPQLGPMGYELVDVEYVKEGGTWYLRVFVDKEGGISVDDCENVSRIMNEWLDREDFISDSYIFEVSSPGLGRPLKKEKDFVRNEGSPVEIHLYKAVDGSKEYEGVLTAWDQDTVTITINDEKLTFDRTDIALIRQSIDF